MQNVPPEQSQKLHDVAESIKETAFGHEWPKEYKELFTLWGFFNSIYNILYPGREEEWKKIGKFAIDSIFSQIWDNLSTLPAVREIAEQPCVGDGRDHYAPSLYTRIAFQTLRSTFKIDLQTVCQSRKCRARHQNNIVICITQQWPTPPQIPAKPEDAVFFPLGATLSIVYQIRNNLFHGSKLEIRGDDLKRNRLLVRNSVVIIRALLEEIIKLTPPKS